MWTSGPASRIARTVDLPGLDYHWGEEEAQTIHVEPVSPVLAAADAAAEVVLEIALGICFVQRAAWTCS